MILYKIFFYFFLFFFACDVNSCNLKEQLNHFFIKEYSLKKKNIKVIIKNKNIKNISCKKPSFCILNRSHPFGLMNILFTCDKLKQYLQVELQVTGQYIIANKFIPKGSHIHESDIKFKKGRLDILPNSTYINKKDVIDTINIYDIFPFQPITSIMVHPLWLVHMNQIIKVIIYGVDFKVFSKGIALNNAYYNQIVYVKINSNHIVTGIVNSFGEAIVYI